ncbi:MAG: ARPP-1 family domain-containing protein, partial [Gaiellales bacterium]
GAKQNRMIDKTTLVHARTPAKVLVKCVERGRWSHRSEHLEPAPRVAYPGLRGAKRHGQGAVWANISAKQARLSVASPTDASEQMYLSRRASWDEYEQALPRVDGQSGVIVGIGGRLVCLDFLSRSDVFAGLYPKLLRGYALDAIESRSDRPLSNAALRRFLGERAGSGTRPAYGSGLFGPPTNERRRSAGAHRHHECLDRNARLDSGCDLTIGGRPAFTLVWASVPSPRRRPWPGARTSRHSSPGS